MDTSLPAQLIGTDSRVLQATQQLSSEFPFNLDVNSGNTIGISEIPDLSNKLCFKSKFASRLGTIHGSASDGKLI